MKRRAMALAFALAIFPLLLILGLAFMGLTGIDYGFSGHAANRVRAFYLADSGVRWAYQERARWRGPGPFYESLLLSTGEVRLEIRPLTDGSTAITARGRSGLITFQVQALVMVSGEIRRWDEQATSGW